MILIHSENLPHQVGGLRFIMGAERKTEIMRPFPMELAQRVLAIAMRYPRLPFADIGRRAGIEGSRDCVRNRVVYYLRRLNAWAAVKVAAAKELQRRRGEGEEAAGEALSLIAARMISLKGPQRFIVAERVRRLCDDIIAGKIEPKSILDSIPESFIRQMTRDPRTRPHHG